MSSIFGSTGHMNAGDTSPKCILELAWSMVGGVVAGPRAGTRNGSMIHALESLDEAPAGALELDEAPAGALELDEAPAGALELDEAPTAAAGRGCASTDSR